MSQASSQSVVCHLAVSRQSRRGTRIPRCSWLLVHPEVTSVYVHLLWLPEELDAKPCLDIVTFWPAAAGRNPRVGGARRVFWCPLWTLNARSCVCTRDVLHLSPHFHEMCFRLLNSWLLANPPVHRLQLHHSSEKRSSGGIPGALPTCNETLTLKP